MTNPMRDEVLAMALAWATIDDQCCATDLRHDTAAMLRAYAALLDMDDLSAAYMLGLHDARKAAAVLAALAPPAKDGEG